MRLIVLGRSGQVATELARAARAGGHAAIFIGRETADLSAPGAVTAALASRFGDVGAVINAAAWTAVDAAEAAEAAAYALNAAMPGAAAATCAAAGVPFLHVSTDYVFDGAGAAPWTPDAPTAPLSAYGRTKLAGEQAVRAAGGPHAILRTAWVFSAHGANFVKTMLRVGAERPVLRVVADQVGGPTPAADIAATLITMARTLAHSHASGTWHLAGAPPISWAGFARAIFEEAGMATEIEEIATEDWPTPAARPRNSRLDVTTLTRDFGIEAPDWRMGLRAVLAELTEE